MISIKKKLIEKTNMGCLCFLNNWGSKEKRSVKYRLKCIEKKKRLKLNGIWIFTVSLKYKYEVK